MANTHNTLGELFTDIADAIREKTGSTEQIVADNFPAEIEAIESGGGVDYLEQRLNGTLTSYSNSNLTEISDYGMYNCTSITSVNVPNIETIGTSAFRDCTNLQIINVPKLSTIPNSAFNGCSSLSVFDFSNITEVGDYAFSSSGLNKAEFANAVELYSNSFSKSTSLTSVVAPSIRLNGTYHFQNCTSLETVTGTIETLGNYSFSGCTNLTTVDISNVFSTAQRAFYNCSSLVGDITLLQASYVASYCFYGCTNIKKVNLAYSFCSSVATYAFYGCSTLDTLIINSESTVPSLANINAFTNTPIASGTGYIYVPSALVDSYKAATNWSSYAEQIRAIEDYPDITGG